MCISIRNDDELIEALERNCMRIVIFHKNDGGERVVWLFEQVISKEKIIHFEQKVKRKQNRTYALMANTHMRLSLMQNNQTNNMSEKIRQVLQAFLTQGVFMCVK